MIFTTNTWVRPDLSFHHYFNNGYFGFFSQNVLCPECEDWWTLDLLFQFMVLLHGFTEKPRSATATNQTLCPENEDLMYRYSIIVHGVLLDNLAVPTVRVKLPNERKKPSPSDEK